MRSMRRFLGFCGGLAAFALVREATAMCRPPTPGSWSDPRVDALFESGQERLRTARTFEGDARKEAAKQAQALFSEIEARVACLPPTVIALAESLELQGKYQEAADHYDRLLEARPELEKHEFWWDSLVTAETARAAALRRIGSVTLVLGKRSCASEPPRAALDKLPLGFGTSRRVNPGSYRVEVTARGCKSYTQVLSVNPGQSLASTVNLEAKPGIPTWAWIAAAATVAVGTGTILALTRSEEPAPAAAFNCPPEAFTCVSLY